MNMREENKEGAQDSCGPARLPCNTDALDALEKKLRTPGVSPQELYRIALTDPGLTVELVRHTRQIIGKPFSKPDFNLSNHLSNLPLDEVSALATSLKANMSKLTDDQRVLVAGLGRTATLAAWIAGYLAESCSIESAHECSGSTMFHFVGELKAVAAQAEGFKHASNSSASQEELRELLKKNCDFDVQEWENQWFIDSQLPRFRVPTTASDLADFSQNNRELHTAVLAAIELTEALQAEQLQNWIDDGIAPADTVFAALVADQTLQMEIISNIIDHYRNTENDLQQGPAAITAPPTSTTTDNIDTPQGTGAPASQSKDSGIISVPPPNLENDARFGRTGPPPRDAKTADEPLPDIDLAALRTSEQLFAAQESDTEPVMQIDLAASTPIIFACPENANYQIESIDPPELPKPIESRVKEIVESFEKIINKATTSDDLLVAIMEELTGTLFKRAALVVISERERFALTVAARGDADNPQRLEYKSELSPLSTRQQSIQSFAHSPKDCSPFGSKAFALAPLDATHEKPVALYADCGTDVILSLEARTVFRGVVELLNNRLPELQGGIPEELT